MTNKIESHLGYHESNLDLTKFIINQRKKANRALHSL